MGRKPSDPGENPKPKTEDQSQPPPSSAAAGAETLEELQGLAAQAAAAAEKLGVRKIGWRGERPSPSSIRKMREMIQQAGALDGQSEALVQLCRDATGAVFEGISVASGEPKFIMYIEKPVHQESKLTRLEYLSKSYANCLAAWGVNFSGPWAATGAALLATFRVVGSISAEIAAEAPPKPKEGQNVN